MLISEALKEERKKLNLTQKEFSDGVCTAANYSKTERNQQQITAQDLLLILSKNNIDINNFIKKVANNYRFSNSSSKSSENMMAVKLAEAFYTSNLLDIKKIDEKIQHSNFRYELKLESTLLRHIIQNDLSNIPPKVKEKYKRVFFTSDGWYEDPDNIRLFSNTMIIFDDDELEFLMSEFLKSSSILIGKNVYVLEVGASVLVNYLYICYRRKIKNKVDEVRNKLQKMPEIPELFTYKCLGNYYMYLINGNIAKAKTMKKFMEENGLNSFMNNLHL